MPKWLYKSLTDGKIVKTQEEYDAAIAAGYMCIDDLPPEAFTAPAAPAAPEEDDEDMVPAEDHMRAVEHIGVQRDRIAELEAKLAAATSAATQPVAEEPAATVMEVQDATAVMETEGAPAAEEATEENTAPETAEQRRDRKAAEMLARNAKK